MNWLADCHLGDERFNSLGEAWADAGAYTREISPHIEAQHLRAMRAVFLAAASEALKAAQESDSFEQFETIMAARWKAFLSDCVLPFIRPRSLPAFAPDALRNEVYALIEHHHGYWQGGVRAALLCLRANCAPAALRAELEAAHKEVRARHVAEGKTL
jgi:hypothetical protein